MRNSKRDMTPKNNKKDVQNEDKTSAKKLVQARLPFKVIAPEVSPKAEEETKINQTSEARKRKLSYESHEEVNDDEEANTSKENVDVLTVATKKKRTGSVCNDTIADNVISLLDDDDEEDAGKEDVVDKDKNNAAKLNSTIKTPKSDKVNIGAGTPLSSKAKKEKTNSASKLQIKLPITSGKKLKKRKSKRASLSANTSISDIKTASANESSDDIEEVAIKENPQKRTKLAEEGEIKQIKSSSKKAKDTIELETATERDEKNCKKNDESEKNISTDVDQEDGKTGNGSLRNTSNVVNKQNVKENITPKPQAKPVEQRKKAPETEEKIQEKRTEKQQEKEKTIELDSDSDKDEENCKTNETANVKVQEAREKKVENDQEKTTEKQQEKQETIELDSDSDKDEENCKLNNDSANANEKSISTDADQDDGKKHDESVRNTSIVVKENTAMKNLTPKQAKIMEQRKKAREEKEKKIQDEKIKKQQEKEEKELARKKEREEKEEQRRKEREEKDEQKRKEREEREKTKNEEKRKRNEAREEELRKKEEERKRKDLEKEEAELKKKKAAQAITKFFVPKTQNNTQNEDEQTAIAEEENVLAFQPFQVKGDMKLAPIIRKVFSTNLKQRFDSLIQYDECNADEMSKSKLYLSELSSGSIIPGKWRRPSTESKDDVIFVDDEMDRVGQVIVEDCPLNIREKMRVKFFKFHDNRRPPYYGTWRKRSSVITPRRPLNIDNKHFDYNVDSDDEWEEEEPGESLDGSDDEKEKESEDEDYEVDNEWFVPHGHLSDEELQNEEELGANADNTREAQKAKLHIIQQEFAQEMKKKTEKIKPRLIGCIWADENGNQPELCPKIIWDTLELRAMLCASAFTLDEVETEKTNESTESGSGIGGGGEKTSEKIRPISFSENMIKDLIKLVHGNSNSKNFIINEFIAYVEKTVKSVQNGDELKPLKSVIRDKMEEISEWLIVDANAMSFHDQTKEVSVSDDGGSKKKKKNKRRLCWVVKQEMLDKYDMSLNLRNAWEYILMPKSLKTDGDCTKTDETNKSDQRTNNETNTTTANTTTTTTTTTANDNTNTTKITKFTKILTTAEEKTNNLKRKSVNELKTSKSSTTDQESLNTSPQSTNKKLNAARSVATPKNKLISEFLRKDSSMSGGIKNTKLSSSPSSSKATKPQPPPSTPQIEDNDIVILD